MTSEIIREIIDDLKKTNCMLDCEKTVCLTFLCNCLYEKESEPFRKEIDELIDKWG